MLIIIFQHFFHHFSILIGLNKLIMEDLILLAIHRIKGLIGINSFVNYAIIM